ncbi:hypothetical protein [uncultured Kingella sp.]|nr:hypothetical protein [uncultured Kingella sp.]
MSGVNCWGESGKFSWNAKGSLKHKWSGDGSLPNGKLGKGSLQSGVTKLK